MNRTHKAYVSLYAKIYTENFSNEMIDRYATGEEIYKFLLKDARCCLPLRGDCHLWYLGCNEKFGSIRYRNHFWKWSFGEASFDNVEQFVNAVYQDGLFTEKQYQRLLKKIEEGREIGDMYKIADYLSRKNKPKSKQKINTEKENCYV